MEMYNMKYQLFFIYNNQEMHYTAWASSSLKASKTFNSLLEIFQPEVYDISMI